MVRVRVGVGVAATCSLSAAFTCTVLLRSSVFVTEAGTACTAGGTCLNAGVASTGVCGIMSVVGMSSSVGSQVTLRRLVANGIGEAPLEEAVSPCCSLVTDNSCCLAGVVGSGISVCF